MNTWLLVVAAITLWGGGFLAAARRGRQVRHGLVSTSELQRSRIAELEAAVAQAGPGDELHTTIRELLGPISERERVGHKLAAIVLPRGGRASLTTLLADIATCVGLDTVLLSDADGLLLAAVGDDGSGVAVSGVSSILVTFAERSVAAGAPAPTGIVVHDEANRTLLHRMFRVGKELYVLTAVSRGRPIAPNGLDPALGKLEQLLAADPLADAAP